MGKSGLHIVVTVNAAWNIWNFRRDLMAALIADGHRVTILAPSDEHVAKLQEIGCEFRPLEMDRKGFNPLAEIALFRRFHSAFGELKPDVVLGYTIKNNIFGSLAARLRGIPFIPNVTGLGTAFLSSPMVARIARTLYRAAFAKADTVFFQNEDDAAMFVEQGMVRREQVQVLPGSGINLDEFAPAPSPRADDLPVVLMIARLLRDKGVMEFVEAAPIVRERHPNAILRLVGAAGSDNRTSLSLEDIHALEASHGVHYAGPTDDVRGAIAEATMVVLPSYREGAPRTLIEAAAMARPLVATDVPGCRAVVDDGGTGFLCDVRNSASLADAIIRMLDLPASEREAIGAAGRAKMEREYSVAIIAAHYREAIARATGKSAHA
ncbi:glycosyltransferase family 4 protein [Aurantiacibacter gangjinensis]|uniref:Uncharacterized protein n=1 Tax=Aurantiacibacter gangjinensis TaxID=502682 RepID=A0A0G9MMC9_9SPHN|nr:glycosyltransferase family 4 protein [Aurantiacibacter gangjinensis]APE27880.1 Lipid carrier : UDP-N-acetylgalactosaminyltransferase / Alpha-1,3-N-acetylgalactosamine transferase PglA [Aurantiacibacter gangjinensis]KLE31845.1 hypothetical protein AAW01_10220 [Aurantiacibacter gangjinensis]